MAALKLPPLVAAAVFIAMGLLIYRNISNNFELLALRQLQHQPSNCAPHALSASAMDGGGNASQVHAIQATGASERNLAPVLAVQTEACRKPALWGTDHQGGWHVCLDSVEPSSCLVYSFGLGADWSFDKAAESFGCEVHGFDPSGSLWRKGMYGKGFHHIDYARLYPSAKRVFHNWGIGGADVAVYPPHTVPQEWPGLGDPPFSFENPEPWELRSVQNSLATLGHAQRTLSILKIDVEGAEWTALQSFIGNDSIRKSIAEGKLQQLLVEFHWDPESRHRNARNARVIAEIQSLGFIAWKVARHAGSECCLDISYVWKGSQQSVQS